MAALLIFSLSGCATAPHTPMTGPAAAHGTESVNYSFGRGVFVWPVKGYVIRPFAMGGKVQNKGIEIKAEEGSGVRAARGGKVVYCDPYLKGFGKTIIIDHSDGYQTVYAYNSEILVKAGDTVSQNDVIARAGKTGRAEEASVHFEIRKNGEAQDPLRLLPR